MADAGIQLYTLREVERPLPAILEAVAEAGYDGVEFAYRLADADSDAVADALDSTGLGVAGAHVRLEWLEDDLDGTLSTYRALGCERIVLAVLDPSRFESASSVDRAADLLSELGREITDRGFAFGYHNHRHEFAEVGRETAYARLVERTDPSVFFELDIGLALGGGADPVPLIERFGHRIPMLHMKDFDAAEDTSVDLGDGDVDFDACLAAAGDGVEWLLYEYDDPDDPIESMRRAAEVLSGLV